MVVVVAVSSCRGDGSPPLPTEPASAPETTTTATPPTTERLPPTTPATIESRESLPYAAVAWEAGGWLQIVVPLPEDQQAACGGEEGRSRECGPVGLRQEQALPPGPHNVAAFGPVVLITHPREGLVSSYDVETTQVSWAPVGIEPHDVKFSPDGTIAYVADEAGRRLITIDPATLAWHSVVDLPGSPHDLAVDGETVWVTLVGRPELARLQGGTVELVEVGGSPHDLVVDAEGRIWLTHWHSVRLSVFDPVAGTVEDAPAGVVEPHHFAAGPDGTVWVSDNGGHSVVGMAHGEVIHTVEVGPTPHHLAFLGPYLVVAVSGEGTVAVIGPDGNQVGEVAIDRGLHGVAAGEGERIPDQFAFSNQPPGVGEWTLAPCAVAAGLGQRVLCPHPESEVQGGTEFVMMGESFYDLAYDAPDVEGNVNHPDVSIVGQAGGWSATDLREGFPGEDVDTIATEGRRLRIRQVVPYEEGGGYHGGHTVALWEEGGWAYAVSIHGHTPEVHDQVLAHAASLHPWPIPLEGADLGEVPDCRAQLPDRPGPQVATSDVSPDGTVDVAGQDLLVAGQPVAVRVIWEPARSRTRVPPGVDPTGDGPAERLLAEVQDSSFCRRLRVPVTASGSHLLGVEIRGVLPIYGLIAQVANEVGSGATFPASRPGMSRQRASTPDGRRGAVEVEVPVPAARRPPRR